MTKMMNTSEIELCSTFSETSEFHYIFHSKFYLSTLININ